MLPGEPDYASSNVDTDIGAIKMHSFTVETNQGQTAFFVFYSDYPEDQVNEITDPGVLLRNARDGVIGKDGTTKTREVEVEIGGYPGIDFDFEQGNGANKTFGNWRLYMVNNRLYQIGIISIGEPADDYKTKTIMNSFDLLKK